MHIPSIIALIVSLAFAATSSASPVLEKRIVGGEPGQEGELPFIAQFVSRFSPCTGFLIGPQTIMTVGGTVYKVGNSTEVAEYVPHPQYNGTLNVNDIGLVFLSKKANGPFAQIGSKYPEANSKIMAAGFGYIDTRGTETDVLRKVRLNVGGTQTCKAYKANFQKKTQFCTTDTPLGHAVCGGDSGGPLYTGSGEKLRVVGIVSHGVGENMCGVKGAYQYYTFIKPYLSWVKAEIKQFEKN
ncbi:hypothetical protein BGZ54_007569 [Gamsiella multidivaricata]|nr:hypothetical protein BGZ54_007569 [Gamsiella multidivaricata]